MTMNHPPFDNLAPEIIHEIQHLETARRISKTPVRLITDRMDEEFLRGIYSRQSEYQLEMVEKLLSIVRAKKPAPNDYTLVVGLFSAVAVNPTMRVVSMIKERFLIELEKMDVIKNLKSQVVEVPDVDGPFTIDAIVANFSFDGATLPQKLKKIEHDLKKSVRNREACHLKFANGYLDYGKFKVPFYRSQGKIVEILFENRMEKRGNVSIRDGTLTSVQAMLKIANRKKDQFRDDVRRIRSKLRKASSQDIHVDVLNPDRGAGKYLMIVEYPE